jgi:hypothetical protein
MARNLEIRTMRMTTTDTLDPLMRDLIEWVGNEPKPYRDVLDAWRTSCPRLTMCRGKAR